MAIEVKAEARIPAGQHSGIITAAEETTKTFDPRKGPEAVVEVTIQPAWKDGDKRTLPVNVTFAPVVNGLSALSEFLRRIGQEPEPGTAWEPATIIGTEVVFSCKETTTGGGTFINVVKNTIRAAPQE